MTYIVSTGVKNIAVNNVPSAIRFVFELIRNVNEFIINYYYIGIILFIVTFHFARSKAISLY